MPVPQPGDVIIRDVVARQGEYIVTDAFTAETLRGPFNSIAEATSAAIESTTGRVWRENRDHRGRPMGPPFPLSP